MKVNKNSLSLVNNKKSAFSTTVKVHNLKEKKGKTNKNEFQNAKKKAVVKQKLQLALNRGNLQNISQKPKNVKSLYEQFLDSSNPNFKVKKFKKPFKGLSKRNKNSDVTKGDLTSPSNLSQSKVKTFTSQNTTEKVVKKFNSKGFEKSKIPTEKLSKRKGWNHNPSKKKKVAKVVSKPFSNQECEAKLDINKVTSVVNGLFKLFEAKSKNSPDLLNAEQPIFMEVECVKVIQCPIKQIRFKLPNPLVNEMSDVLLITPDLKGHKPDVEKSVDHYTELLKKHDITFIQKVMPIRMLRQEYSQHEMKRKLSDQFDMILADASIAKSLPKILGRTVMYKSKMPIAVHLDRKDLKTHLQIAISKTQMTVKPGGHISSVKVGHTKMSASEVAANIVEISKTLSQEYPEGWKNVRSLHVKTTDFTPVLLYLSFMTPNMVKPKVKVSKKDKVVEGELSTYPDKTVVVQPDGSVFFKTEKKRKAPVVDDSKDDEILKEAQKYIQLSRTIRNDDNSEDENEKNAEAITNAMEKELLKNYNMKASKAAKQKNDEESEGEEEEEESSEEEDLVLPLTGKKRKLAAKKEQKGSLPSKKAKETTQQQRTKKDKQKGDTDQILRRGSRGGKKNKLNKTQRKAQIKRKKAGKSN